MDSATVFDLVMRDQDFIIYQDDQPLLTVGGNEYSHPNDRLLKHILTDVQVSGMNSTEIFTGRRLFEFQKDFLDGDKDFIRENYDLFAREDHFIRLKTGVRAPGVEKIAEAMADESKDKENALVNLVFWSISPIVIALNAFIAEKITLLETEENSEDPVIFLVKQEYLGLPVQSKAVFHFLAFIHRAGLVLPVLLLTGRITASEYAKGLISLHVTNPVRKSDSSFIIKDLAPILCNEGSHEQLNVGLYSKYLFQALAGLDYLSFFSAGFGNNVSIEKIARSGENSGLEFKSTLRWDLKQGKANSALEKASLKTIAAFLNSQGGTLLIGVRDDGSVEGIETDKFLNEDKFLLHLWTLIRTTMGRDISTYLQITLEKADSRTVCMIRCAKSIRPVFLKMPGFEEEFYIRLGPSSNALNISEALKYIADRFGNGEGVK